MKRWTMLAAVVLLAPGTGLAAEPPADEPAVAASFKGLNLFVSDVARSRA